MLYPIIFYDELSIRKEISLFLFLSEVFFVMTILAKRFEIIKTICYSCILVVTPIQVNFVMYYLSWFILTISQTPLTQTMYPIKIGIPTFYPPYRFVKSRFYTFHKTSNKNTPLAKANDVLMCNYITFRGKNNSRIIVTTIANNITVSLYNFKLRGLHT